MMVSEAHYINLERPNRHGSADPIRQAPRVWTQSLAASTLIHATYNGTIFTILFFVTSGFRHLDKIK